MTSDARADGHDPAPTITTPRPAGRLFNAPFVDARRSAMNTNDLRGKVMRIKVATTAPTRSRPATCSRPARPGRAPEIYAMGFRNPFRIQVDSNDVAYITDYSPDSQGPQTSAGRRARAESRSCASRPTTAGRSACAQRAEVPVELQHPRPLDPANPEPYECDNPAKGPDNTSKWNTGQRMDPTVQPGRVQTPPITQPDIWYSYSDNQTRRWARRASRPRRAAPTARDLPAALPRAVHGRRRTARRHGVRVRPDNPSETKFPPYYDGAMIFGEFTQDTMREVRFDSNNKILKINPFLNCGAGPRPHAVPVRVRQPDGHAVRGRRELLPADLRRRLLHRQRRRRHVPVGVHEGPAGGHMPSSAPRRGTARRR